jgi:LacI family transcriptional regulator
LILIEFMTEQNRRLQDVGHDQPGRATIVDVARSANVSTATVDRVLNARAGVKERTRQQVLQAAQQLGYIEGAAKNVVPPVAETVRLDFLLPGASRTFMGLFARHLGEQAALRQGDVTVQTHHYSGMDPLDLARSMHALAEQGTQGMGIVAADHPVVREAVRALSARGVPILNLMTDVSGSSAIGYVGIDNRAAGRLAAHLLGRFVTPTAREIALFTGSHSYRGHEEREMGFRNLVAEEFRHLEIVEFREIREDSDRAYEETRGLLAAHPNLAGIYNIGGGLRSMAQALKEAGAGSRVVLVGHELTDPVRAFLIDGTIDAVIDQNPRVEARDAIEHLRRAALGQPPGTWVPLRTQAIFRENMPE